MNLYSDPNRYQLQKLTVLYVVLNSTGHRHQRFERALLWDMVTWCSLSSQKFNTTLWVWFQIASHTSSPEYREVPTFFQYGTKRYIILFLSKEISRNLHVQDCKRKYNKILFLSNERNHFKKSTYTIFEQNAREHTIKYH